MNNTPKNKVVEDLYLVIRAMYHQERNLATRFGLGFEEIYALQYLRRNPGAHLSDVSQEMDQPMFKASRMITRLIEKGFVIKSQGEVDRRNIHIKLQPAGEKILREIDEFCYEKVDPSSPNKDDKHYSQMAGLAERFHQYLGPSGKKD